MTTLLPLHLTMSNACLVSGKKHILIDSGISGDLRAIEKQLQKQGVDLREIALIVLTHVHFDHAGNVAAIQKLAGCPVAVHRSEKSLMESGKNAAIIPVHPVAALMTPFMQIPFRPAAVDIVFDDAFDLNPFGVDAQVVFTPGHTPGSVSVLTGSGEAIVGDLIGGGLLLGQFQPEKPRYHYWASSMDQVRASVKTVLGHRPNKIHVGHGGPLNGKQARAFFLDDVF